MFSFTAQHTVVLASVMQINLRSFPSEKFLNVRPNLA